MRVHASRGEAAPQASPGLVSVSTSDTVGSILEIERDVARFTRLQKNVGMAAKLHMLDLQGKRVNAVMVTLTYANDDQWQPHHVSNYLKAIREWHKRLTGGKPLRYVWVGETTKRGRLHYHVIFWLPKGVSMPKADKRGWWPHGMTNTLKATAPVAYLVSYAKKFASKEGIPHGARIYGVGGLDQPCRRVRRWLNWPSFVQARAAVSDCWRPAAGGGWASADTGEWLPSEYGLSYSTQTRTVVIRLHDHGRPVANVVGPYNWIPNTGGAAAPCVSA